MEEGIGDMVSSIWLVVFDGFGRMVFIFDM